MIRDMRKWILLTVLFFACAGGIYPQENSKGALILVSTEGKVRFVGKDGKDGPAVEVGMVVPAAQTIVTGRTGRLVGLLSNGTLLTLTENTRMRVATFEQAPFVDDGRKLAELSGEPSVSKVLIDLDIGSLVVKTKKLNKGSSFDINSPVGVAGIRGTEFQMATYPGQGVQLDVTESTVAYTPPGGSTVPVTQGNGLSVSPSGVPTPRRVNPVVATKIASVNKKATEATQEVSLKEVSVAVEQAAKEPDPEPEPESEPTQEEETSESSESDSESSESDSESSESEESSPVEDTEESTEPAEEKEPEAAPEEAPVEEEQESVSEPTPEEPKAEEEAVSEPAAEEPAPSEPEPASAEETQTEPIVEDTPETTESSPADTEPAQTAEESSGGGGQVAEPAAPEASAAPEESPAESAPAPPAKEQPSKKKQSSSNTTGGQESSSSTASPQSEPSPKEPATVAQTKRGGEKVTESSTLNAPASQSPSSKEKSSSTGRGESSPAPVLQKSEPSPKEPTGAAQSSTPVPSSTAPSQGKSSPSSSASTTTQSPRQSAPVVAEVSATPVAPPVSPVSTPVVTAPPAPAPVAQPRILPTITPTIKVEQPDRSMLTENNPALQKNQKLSKYGLSTAGVARYDQLSPQAQEDILGEDSPTVVRLLGLAGLSNDKADLYFEYDRETRDLLLGMSDDVLVSLLDPEVDRVLLKESLQKIELDGERSSPDEIPVAQPDLSTPSAQRIISLGDRLMENGNSELMEELLVLSGGNLDDSWIRVGEVAESLSRGYEISDFSGMEEFAGREALDNPFALELANVYDQLEIDGLINGVDKVLGGKNLIVQENAQALGSLFTEGVDEVVLMSHEIIEFRGSFGWEAQQATGARLVVMAGEDLLIREGSTLESATSDLIISTRQDLLLKQVELNMREEVAIRGMRDVELNHVTLGADARAVIKARRDLNVDGLYFKRDIQNIVMEATTLRLRNIDFPGASQVQLNSLKGGVDGRYPNFGTTIPATQQIGRVNFIENIRSAGNLLHDRPSFDQHGKNITIGKINRP